MILTLTDAVASVTVLDDTAADGTPAVNVGIASTAEVNEPVAAESQQQEFRVVA